MRHSIYSKKNFFSKICYTKVVTAELDAVLKIEWRKGLTEANFAYLIRIVLNGKSDPMNQSELQFPSKKVIWFVLNALIQR